MRALIAPRTDGERGFILVGVVTFMLALTILGLSLFALSSYEAQFFATSATREQALQNCESGMSLVQALLESRYPRNLENAQLAVGQFGITGAIAYQGNVMLGDTVSRGPVQWDSTIVIILSAKSGNAERTIQATYQPIANANPYQRLVTASRIIYNTSNGIQASSFQVTGRIWQYVQSAADTAWTDAVTWASGRPLDPSQTPTPLGDAFVDARLAGLTTEAQDDYEDKDDYSLEFLNNGPGPRFFRSPPSPTDEDTQSRSEYDQYTFYSDPGMTLYVRGTAVWVVPRGVCFRRRVTIKVAPESGSSNALVIVAKANGRDRGHEDLAIWFQGGLRIESNGDGDYPSVYLVSEKDIALTHNHMSDKSNDARRTSVVAGGTVELGGPDSNGRFQFGYSATAMDALGELLLAQGALPAVSGGSATAFDVLKGSWAETTPR